MKSEHILAVNANFELHGSSVTQLIPHTVIAQREWLETNTDFRQLLPYITLARYTPTGNLEYLLYRRVKGSGESRLIGGYSIGFGGHVDLEDIVMDRKNNTVDIIETFKLAIQREMSEETDVHAEAINKVISKMVNEDSVNYIKLDLNNTDKAHLGCALTAYVDRDVEVKEDAMLKVGWYTADQLEDQFGDVLENWSAHLVSELITTRQYSELETK
jgi:predicted NUDIX family phosphoesterase